MQKCISTLKESCDKASFSFLYLGSLDMSRQSKRETTGERENVRNGLGVRAVSLPNNIADVML